MNDSSVLQLTCPSCGAVNRVPSSRLGDEPVCGKCRSRILDGEPLAGSDASFQRLVQKNDLPVVVDFWAPWCGPCHQFAPVFAEVASEMAAQARFVKVDTEANQQTAARFGIRSIPTLMLFSGGKEIARLSGALPKGQFVQWLNQHIG